MRIGLLSAIVLAGSALGAMPLLAEEGEVYRERPAEVVVPPPAGTTIERRSTTECHTETVHSRNDMGESVTVKKTVCD